MFLYENNFLFTQMDREHIKELDTLDNQAVTLPRGFVGLWDLSFWKQKLTLTL